MRGVRPGPAARGRRRRRRELGRGEELIPLVICADWSAGRAGRAAWAADAAENAVFELSRPPRGWTAAALVDEAEELRGGEPALVCFDAPLGVPASFLRAWGYASFVDWMMGAPFDDLFVHVEGPDGWSALRPFVRPRARGWTGAVALARQGGLDPWRQIDRRTRAESMFKLVGPKQVGRAAQELWRELREARQGGHLFRVWPFETELAGDGVVVAEIYPRAAYAEILGGTTLLKREAGSRARAATLLQPEVRDPAAAAATEDDLDAAVTATALLRRVRRGRPLADPAHVDPVAEGGMLCG